MTLEPNDPRHGSAHAYNNLGCRCPACREANRLSKAQARARGGRSGAYLRVTTRASRMAVAVVRADYPDVWAACVAKAKAELGFDDVPDRRRKP